MSKKMSQEKAYDEWQEWLEKCPVSYTHGRHPTSFIEVINFDFNDMIVRRSNENNKTYRV